MKKITIIIILIVTTIFFVLVRNSNVNATEEKTILFIGNSKTYYNNLPEKVAKIAELDGNYELPDLNHTSVTKGGKNLEWFYEERETYNEDLLSNKWDYVVLQEGRLNALDDDKLDDFKNGAKNLIEYLKQNNVVDENTTIIYHATWIQGKESASSTSFYSLSELKADQDKANEHYRAVKDYVEKQTNIKGKIAYSGSNFISAIEKLGVETSSLYKDEENNAAIHSTNAGTYLAACTIYETIFQSQVKDLSGEGAINPYDGVLDNTYEGEVSYATVGVTTKVDDELRQKCQYVARTYVDITPAVIRDITVSNEEWTNVPVTIELKADDNIYKVIINGEEAQNNNETYSFSATSNGEYIIKVIDLVGHESNATRNISNIDLILPTESQPLVTSTTKSIKVTSQQEDTESGIDESKTRYRLTDENGSMGEWQISNVFEGLIANKTYYVQTQVTDKAGNSKDSKIISINTESIPKLDDENTNIQISNTNWTKEDVTVEVTTSVTGYELQTKVGEKGTWSNKTTIKLTENDTIYIRLTDGVNMGNELSKEIDNIDKTAPTETQPLVTSTTKSIKVTSQQEDKESGIDESKTRYRLTDENGSIGEWQISNVFEGLIANKTYYVQTQATDKAENSKDSKIISIKTESIPELDDENTNIQISNTNWTKEDVTVEVTTSVTGYELQTKVGEKGTWSNETTIKLTENDTIYIRLTDGVSVGNELSKEIDNIDKTAPTETQPLVTSTTKSIKVTSQQKDKESGIDSSKTRYRLTDENGSIGEWQISNVFEGLIANTTYYVQTQATDNVGNISNSEIIIARTNEIPNLNNLNTRFKLSNTNWTNESIEVEIEITDEELLKNINSGIYSIQTYVELLGNEENTEKDYKNELKRTFETNGRLYVRLTDGTHMGNEYFCNITKIDKNSPTILGIEDNAKYLEHATITDIIDKESGVKEIELIKNQEKIEFTLGKPIVDVGAYKLTVIDNANNSISISFEIVKNNYSDSDNGNNENNNNNNNSSGNSTEDKNTSNKDNTTVNKEIPKAGKNTYILLGIIIFGIMIVKCYMTLKNISI